MNVGYSAIAELSNINFLHNDLRNPYPIPQENVRKIRGFEQPMKSFDGRVLNGQEAYNKNKPLILEILRNTPRYTTVSLLAQAIGLNASSVGRAMRQLHKMGLVVSTKAHIAGFKKGTVLWRLKEKEE